MNGFLLIIPILFLLSCKGEQELQENNDTKILPIRLDGESTSPSKLSDVIDSVSFISIASDSNILLGNITDIHLYKDHYYILDAKSAAIFKIDKAGNIVQTLSKRGRAPGEYLNIDAFDVNPSNGDIHIYDWASKHILIYNTAGDYIKTIAVKEVIRDFAIFPNGEYVFYTPDFIPKNQRGLWRADTQGNFKERLIHIDKNFRYGGLRSKYFNRLNDSTVSLMGGEDHDRIYHIQSDTIIVKFKLDIDRKLSAEVKQTELLDRQKYAGQYYIKNNYIETQNILLFEVTDFQKQVLVFYNKQNQQIIQIRGQKDLIEDIDTYCKAKFGGNGVMIGVVEVGQILSHPYFQKKFPKINSDSNPILAIMYMK